MWILHKVLGNVNLLPGRISLNFPLNGTKFLQTWNCKLRVLCALCGFFSEISPLSLCVLYKLILYIVAAFFHLRKRNPSGKSCNVIQSPSLYIDFSDFWIMNKSVWHFFQHKTLKWIFLLFRRYKLLSVLRTLWFLTEN